MSNIAADDNCGEVSISNNFSGLSNLCGATGAATVIWTATDDCGNTATTSATFTIVDTQAPSLVCPQNITVNTDNGACGAYVQVPIPDTDDDCSGVTLVNDHTGTAIASGYYETGTTVIVFTATDACGNASTCQMTITVVDNEDPQITCPEDITVNNDPGVCEAYVTVPQPVVSDNCGVASFTNSFTQTNNASAVYSVGTTEVIWTVVDGSGNTSTCTMTITVIDNEAPVIVCPEDLSVTTDAGVCEANVTVPQPEASDNCGIENMVNSFNGTSNASGIYPVGTTVVTWTVTDIHGLTAECSMNITVTDDEAPVIVCPEDIAVNNDPGVCEANVTVPQPEVSDNCGIENMVNSFNGTDNASGVYSVGTTIVTWTVTDIHGLTAECSMNITVTDNEAPVIVCPEDMAVNNDPDCNAMVEIPEPEVSDNCGIENVVNSYTNTGNASGTYAAGVHTITWTVTDIHGNVAECEMQLTVTAGPTANDDQATTEMNIPVNIAVLLNDTDCDENIDPTTVTVISDPANGFTMVDPQTGSIMYTPNTDYTGTDTFTYSVCDLSGLCDEAMVTITISGGNPQLIYLVAVNDSYSTLVNTSKLINNMENDNLPDVEGVVAAIQILVPTSNGSLDLHEDMTITYTPATDFTGEDQFTYILYDINGIAISDTAIAVITVVPDDARPEVVIYNGITPNGDGRNDGWIIDGIEEYPDNEVLIFNRWADQLREFI